MLIDLREIPSPKSARGEVFEFFARDFLSAQGFEIVDGPDRGQDGGCDLLVREEGSITRSPKLWLVSAKHYAHSEKAVRIEDEPDLEGRLSQFGASGLLAVYSTLPSTPLARRFQSLHPRFSVFVYDAGRIGQALLSHPALEAVFRRYLPNGYAQRNAMERTNSIRVETEPGAGLTVDEPFALDLSELLERDDHGATRFCDRDLEDVVAACILADALRNGRFGILDKFTSFRPVVWRYLAHFMEAKGLDARAVAVALERTSGSHSVRLLIKLAGATRQKEMAKAICRKVLEEGHRHARHVAGWSASVTPFFHVVREALANLSDDSLECVERAAEEARASGLWQEKQAFEWAARQLRKQVVVPH